jgi:MFS family permease
LQFVYLLPLVASAVGFVAVRVVRETAPVMGLSLPVRIQRISVPEEVRRPFWVAAGGIVACYSLYGLFAALVPSYVRGDLATSSPLAAGAIVALMFGMAALTQLTTAQIHDRRALLVGLPLLFGTLVALVLILSATTWTLLVLVTAVLGVSVGLTFMGSVTLVDRVAPEEKRGEILAGFYSAGYLALAIPTIGLAAASEQIGFTNAGILFGSILAAVVALLYLGTVGTPTPPGGGGRQRAPGRAQLE